jgi:acetyltransferase
VQFGKDEKVSAITADILSENVAMRRICTKLGFQLTRGLDDNVVNAVLLLDS